MTDIAAAERAALADLMASVGPDAPTLCAGWLTRDLAAHIIARERRPDASGGIMLRPLAGYLKHVQDGIATRDWADLVAAVRRPPWWSPISNRWLDEATNRIEFFVHHEDVRRAQDGWRPRQLSPDVSAALWRRVRALARLVLRRVPAAVTVVAPGFGEAPGGRGGPPARLAGEPQELLLFLTGRQDHALVELTGPEKITERMRRGRYGI
ncbi:MAG: TIGR03085 family metal-binding protein [Micromonosporaceae bacterium]